MDENRGPFTGHQVKPRQLRPSRVTIEHIEQGEGDARISGLFDVSIAGATWRERPEYGEAIEQEIEDAIRRVLQRYAQ
jgi:hypothetical protein